MTEKTKRKVNPRQRLLIRLIVGIAILAVLISAAIYTLQPKGAQIVFIAPDDNGIDQLWLADLNDPEHPRQLTFHQRRVATVQTSNQGTILLYSIYSVNSDYDVELWYMNLTTKENRIISFLCNLDYSCEGFQLSPDGKWLSYQEIKALSYSDDFVYSAYIHNLFSGETRLVHEQYYYDIEGIPSIYISPFPTWVGNTGLLTYRISGSDGNYSEDEFVTYDIEKAEIVDSYVTETAFITPTFSDDGNRYIYFSTNTGDCCGFPNIYVDDDFESQLAGQFRDWHPNNQSVLFINGRNVIFNDTEHFGYELILFNPTTSEQNILTLYYSKQFSPQIKFNHDGSLILYHATGFALDSEKQIMLYDMESGEEIALPLFGRNPLWVNGGR